MKKRTLILGAAALVAVLAVVPIAFAQHFRARGMGMHGAAGGDSMMMLRHLQQAQAALGLTDQQVADIKAIFQDLRAQNAASRDQLRGNFKAIADALIANPNDLATAQAMLEKQDAAEHAMKLNALTAASKALNVLTPDQRAKLADHMTEHTNRFAK